MNSNGLIGITDHVEGSALELFPGFRIYPFTMLIGIIASILSILYFWRKNKFPFEILLTLIIITIPSAIVGARLFWIIEEAINGDDLSKWYAIWTGGLSIQGGVILPTIFNLLYLRRKRNVVDVRKVFGIILPNVLLGQAIGRWGNFANHELFGAPIDYDKIAWLGKGISWNMYINGEFRTPLFLIESSLSLLGYIVIVWIFLQFSIFKPGTTGGIYLLYYGIVRVVLEPLRTDKDFEYWYLVLAIFFIVGGVLLIGYFEWSGRKIYKKVHITKYSNYWYNTKTQIVTINASSKWINQ